MLYARKLMCTRQQLSVLIFSEDVTNQHRYSSIHFSQFCSLLISKLRRRETLNVSFTIFLCSREKRRHFLAYCIVRIIIIHSSFGTQSMSLGISHASWHLTMKVRLFSHLLKKDFKQLEIKTFIFSIPSYPTQDQNICTI